MSSTLIGDVAGQHLPARDPLSHMTIHKYLVQPSDVGGTGFVDGGTVLDWIHRAGHATATRWSGGRCVAASLANFHLARPIGVGESVAVFACLVYTGTTSLHVLVTVVAGDDANPQTAQCPIVFVAVDEVGDPTAVPPWTPDSMLELQRHRQARMRIRTRKLVEDAISKARYVDTGFTPFVAQRIMVSRNDGHRDGSVHGGRVIRWIDEVANVCAASWLRVSGLTSYVASIRFCGPVAVGDRVTVTARLVHTGTRSVHVGVRLVTTDVVTGMTSIAAEGLLVVAAPDEHGHARPVTRWTPECADDIRLDRHGMDLLALRQLFEPYSAAAELHAASKNASSKCIARR